MGCVVLNCLEPVLGPKGLMHGRRRDMATMLEPTALRDAASAVAWEDITLRLREYLDAEATSAENIFREADKDGSGYLELPELAQLVRKMLPAVNDDEIKYLLTSLVFMDPDGDGRVSLKELKQVVHKSWA